MKRAVVLRTLFFLLLKKHIWGTKSLPQFSETHRYIGDTKDFRTRMSSASLSTYLSTGLGLGRGWGGTLTNILPPYFYIYITYFILYFEGAGSKNKHALAHLVTRRPCHSPRESPLMP